MVNSSQHAPGQRAHLLFQALSENDTHCLQFSYFMYSRDGRSPGTLSAYVRVTGGPLGSAVWNSSGSHGRQWHQAELAVSLFWPSEYQVSPSRTPSCMAQTTPPCMARPPLPGVVRIPRQCVTPLFGAAGPLRGGRLQRAQGLFWLG